MKGQRSVGSQKSGRGDHDGWGDWVTEVRSRLGSEICVRVELLNWVWVGGGWSLMSCNEHLRGKCGCGEWGDS